MNQQLRSDADQIIRKAIAAVQPDAAVQRALKGKEFPGRVLLVAAGKAAWQMAKAFIHYAQYGRYLFDNLGWEIVKDFFSPFFYYAIRVFVVQVSSRLQA